ncbi:hypothetical protein BDW74DRAFT_45421 [Aspergillus multicolor]|uniref:uncharacterized protein n=1 Tax=Aspergillus multicolor TaxID=41759 RepID=UPI003CCCCC22
MPKDLACSSQDDRSFNEQEFPVRSNRLRRKLTWLSCSLKGADSLGKMSRLVQSEDRRPKAALQGRLKAPCLPGREKLPQVPVTSEYSWEEGPGTKAFPWSTSWLCGQTTLKD